MLVIYHMVNVDKTFLFVKKLYRRYADPNLPSKE